MPVLLYFASSTLLYRLVLAGLGLAELGCALHGVSKAWHGNGLYRTGGRKEGRNSEICAVLCSAALCPIATEYDGWMDERKEMGGYTVF